MVLQYKPYTEYIDSGIDWFGSVPKSWTLTRLKFEATVNMGQSPSSEDCNQDGIGLPFLQGNAEFGLINPSPKQYCETPRKIAHTGQLLFSVRAPVGALNVADQIYGIGRGLCAIEGARNLLNSFLWWLIPIIRSELDAVSTGSTFEAVSAEQVENVSFYNPSLSEQFNISRFLDHEIAKIDTLIVKQQQLILLLKEKRQAVINHAVTKGSNPNAEMRDSGVDWLGKIPVDWDVVSLKHLVSAPIIDGPHTSPTRQEDGIPFISAEAISAGFINFEKKWGYISKEDHQLYSKRYAPQRGDILMVKLGATTGTVAMVETDEAFNIWVPLATIRTRADIPSKFIFYLLQSSSVRDAIQLSWTFGTQQTLGLGTIANLRTPLPPREECEKIIKLIEKKNPIFDQLINKSEHSLLLLKERRAALISAAVTGKIDVRNWVAPEETQSNKEVAA
ncbi:restriction modification system DNA specificity domain-containing protein [Pseudomonas sp. CFII64]|uniref:restriction endonuclease subunit S n=1 Tax=Pseudomonas sp. CFII64 TaxID=911242 RepID=UPI00035756DC|nr:restriction endonuclease subunit S [Pseudomonas sp. CFII64]EPJ88468.1 restriction modification system DNA specificity domain-containing protein [Pseudomonas sp. CFII64]